LQDAEQGLIVAVLGSPTALRPSVGALESRLEGVPVQGVPALIETHDDVGSQLLLGSHRRLRSKTMFGSIDVRPEGDAVLVYTASVGQAVDLEAT
jgi:hypothetical protein